MTHARTAADEEFRTSSGGSPSHQSLVWQGIRSGALKSSEGTRHCTSDYGILPSRRSSMTQAMAVPAARTTYVTSASVTSESA